MVLLTTLCLLVGGLDVQDRLPGSDLSLRDAEKRASIIVVAKLVRLGRGGGGRGSMVFPEAEVSTAEVLKGGRENLHLRTVWLSICDKDEKSPEEGVVYTFFIDKFKGRNRVLKMVRRPKERLARHRERRRSGSAFPTRTYDTADLTWRPGL